MDANEVGVAEFRIRLTDVGKIALEVSARSPDAADAVIKEMLVEPEGVPEELVENVILTQGSRHTLDGIVPSNAVEDSARTLVSVTGVCARTLGSFVAALLRMTNRGGRWNEGSSREVFPPAGVWGLCPQLPRGGWVGIK